jgi:hypothetical protein
VLCFLAAIALFFSLLGAWLFLKSLKRPFWLTISFSAFVISAYTYHAARVAAPLILLTLVILYWQKLSKKWLIASIITATLLAAPLARIVFLGGGTARVHQIGFFLNPTILDRTNIYRSECLKKFPSLACQLMENKYIFLTQEFFLNYFNHFSLNFLFQDINQAIGYLPHGGFFPLSLLPALLIGLFVLFRQKKIPQLLVLSWLLIAPLADSLTGRGQYSRAVFMLIPISLLLGLGLQSILKKNRYLGWTILFLFALESSKFFLDYFAVFPVRNAQFTLAEYQDLFQQVKLIDPQSYPNVYISRKFNDTKQYAFYLFYYQIPPQQFHQPENVNWHLEENGWLKIDRVNNWHFLDTMPSLEKIPNHSLVIGMAEHEIIPVKKSYKDCPAVDLKILTTLYYPNGDPAFAISQLEKTTDQPFPCGKVKQN